jgi:cytochrome c-type biogenesis protein
MTPYLLQALSAYAAGFGISLTPCVYPMIPISVGYLGSNVANASNPKLRVLGFFAGQVGAYTLLGIAAVLLGEMLGFSAEIPAVQIVTGLLLLAFAYASYFEKLPAFLSKLGTKSSIGSKRPTIIGAVLIGASSAAIASPCTSPVLGAVLATVSQVQERSWGVALMFFFAVGLSTLMLVLGLGLAKAKTLPRSGLWMVKVQKASSALLALGGVYFILRGIGLL